jgi:hypothetical protein
MKDFKDEFPHFSNPHHMVQDDVPHDKQARDHKWRSVRHQSILTQLIMLLEPEVCQHQMER